MQKLWPSLQELAEEQTGRQLEAHPSQLLWVRVALVATGSGWWQQWLPGGWPHLDCLFRVLSPALPFSA